MPLPPTSLHKALIALVCAVCLVVSGLPAARALDLRLPEMGDPADTVLSPSEEKKLGAIVEAQIRNQMPVLEDPELENYVAALGQRLISSALDTELRYRFLVLNSPVINAFATPGGVVAIYTGLIEAARNEAELAGVMAHEIAHVSQHHMARMVAESRQITVATALGLLAAIAIGMTGGGNAGAAALQGTMAASAQARLAFSRDYEREADRVGMRLLVASGYDPAGMPDFFERLQRENQLNAGRTLEFLSTHPLTLDRISDTRNRAEQLRHRSDNAVVSDRPEFHYAKARVRALTTAPSAIIARRDRLRSAAERYMLAVAYLRDGQPTRAVALLDELRRQFPDNLWIQLALARAWMDTGQFGKADRLLARIDALFPDLQAVTYYRARSLLRQQRGAEALALLQQHTSRQWPSPLLLRLEARAAAAAGKDWLAHEALADFHTAYGQYGAALEQLQLALRSKGIDPVSQARIRAKRKEIASLRGRERAGHRGKNP